MENKDITFKDTAYGVVVGENNKVTIQLPDGNRTTINKLNYTFFKNAFSKNSNFTGREVELDKISTLAKNKTGEQVIIGICGMAGVGKSSIALRASCDLSIEICKGGVLWADFPTHGGVIQPIFYQWSQLCEKPEILEIPSEEIQIQALKSALTRYSESNGRLIAVFDDVKANLDHNWIDNMHKLHKALPDDCIILVTSRQNNIPLSLRASEIIILAPLEEDVASKLVRKINPNIKEGESLKIANYVGGLPLGIEIASSLSKVEGVDWTINALSNRESIIDFLTIAESNRKEDSVLNSFKLSFDSLPLDLRNFYLSLSVFTEGVIEISWIEKYCLKLWDQPQIDNLIHEKLIRELAGRNLLSKSEKQIRIHPLIKESLNKIAQKEEAIHLKFIQAHIYIFENTAKNNQDYDEIEKSLNNIVRAVDYAKQVDKDNVIVDIVCNIAMENMYLHKRGIWNLAIKLLDKGIESAKTTNSSRFLDLYIEKGVYLREIGEYSGSETIFKDVIKISSYNDEKKHLARALVNLGHLQMYSRDYENALKNIDYALTLSEKINDTHTMGQSYLSKARVFVGRGDTSSGRHYAQISLEHLKKHNELRLIVFAKRVIGRTYAIEKNFDLAITNYRESLLIASELNDLQSQSYILRGMGDLYVDFDNDDEAIRCFNESEKVFTLINDVAALSATLCSLGELCLKNKKYDEARKYFERGSNISVEDRWKGRCLFGLAKIEHFEGEQEHSKSILEDAIQLVRKTNHRDIHILESWKLKNFK